MEKTFGKIEKHIDKIRFFVKISFSAIKITLQLMHNTQLEGG